MKNTLLSFFPTFLFLLLLAFPVSAKKPIDLEHETLMETPVAEAPKQAAGMQLLATGKVKEIVKSDTILLDNNKRYRLDNILIPVYYDRDALEEMNKEFLDKVVSVYTYHEEDTASDRYGVPLTHIIREDGIWIQSQLVLKGLAWAFSSETSRQMVDTLREREAQARAARRGFWVNPAYDIKTPLNVQEYVDSFQIVEGKILFVNRKPDVIYFNFGKDWQADFTIALPRKYADLFMPAPRTPFNALTWKDKTIRIRGWVAERNGTLIELTHPEQIEFISE